METKEEYEKIPEYLLSDRLRTIVDSKIEFVYNVLSEKLANESKRGRTKVCIFVTRNENSKTQQYYDIAVHKIYPYLDDKYCRRRLFDKLRDEGLKIRWWYLYQGMLLKIYWDKKYDKSGCIII